MSSDTWDLQIKLDVITTPRAGAGAEDVPLAVEIATRAFNATDTGVTYRLVTDAAPDGIAAAIGRLLPGKPAAIIAAVAPDEAQAAVAKAAEAKVPIVLVAPPNSTLSGGGTSYLLQASADQAFAGRALALLAARDGGRRIFVYTDEDAFTLRTLAAFRAAAGDAVAQEIRLGSTPPNGIGPLAKQACDAKADTVLLLTTPGEGGSLVQGLESAGCRGNVDVLAAPWTRQRELVDLPGHRTDGRSLAEGVKGITPQGTDPGLFRSAFEAVYGRAPSRFAAAAHDATAYATLAAFASKGGHGAKPFHGTVLAADIKAHLADVSAQPGIKERDFRTAVEAVKAGDDIDWVGFEQDFDLDANHAPKAGAYDVWRISASGGFDTVDAVALE